MKRMDETDNAAGSKFVSGKGDGLEQVPETQEWSEASPPGSAAGNNRKGEEMKVADK